MYGHNPLVQNPPDREVLNQGLCPGGLHPPIMKFSFQNPLSCNRKRHRTLCSNSTGGYVLGVSSSLATDRGVLTQAGYVRGFMSANPNKQ